jgi:hypothetical protein
MIMMLVQLTIATLLKDANTKMLYAMMKTIVLLMIVTKISDATLNLYVAKIMMLVLTINALVPVDAIMKM